jgi:hypothetical protein
MKNCQGTPQAKQGALNDLLALLKALMNKGKFDASLLDGVFSSMVGLLGAKFALGLSGADMRTLVARYLAQAVAQASLAKNAGLQAGATASAVGRFGSTGSSVISSLFPSRNANGGFSDPTRTDPSGPYGRPGVVPTQTPYSPTTGGPTGVAVAGTAITSDEVADYFNGVVRGDTDAFAIGLWIGRGKNPMLMLEALSYAKTLHNDVILPAASYYKTLVYGRPDYPIRLGQVIYGIVEQDVVRAELQGGPPSRHLVGQAVNFRINGIDPYRVVQDLSNGSIPAVYGTLALSAGIHASLPFYGANGQIVQHLYLWSDNGVPNFVGYQFN